MIGNGSYRHARDLPQAPRDAKAVAEALGGLGFRVIPVMNADREELLDALVTFGEQVAGASVGLVYYAGHGIQVDGKNYLVAVDGALEPSRRKLVGQDHVSADAVLQAVQDAGTRLNVVVLDACRNDPFPSGRSMGGVGRGLGGMGASGMMVAFATAPETIAPDDGVYADALVRHLTKPATECVDWDLAFARVQADVVSVTDGTQRPWVNDNAGLLAREMYPSGCEPREAPPPPPGGSVELVRIPGGTFKMGSPKGEEGRGSDEGPQHRVTVDAFWVTKSEITQGLWAEVMSSDPSHFSKCGRSCPVEQVSWQDAVAFANRLSARDGLTPAYTLDGDEVRWDRKAGGYRLLTEAEWEYAARGGEPYLYAGSNEATDVGWVDANAGGKTHPVCGKAVNGYGLCDMTGNVREWVWDRFATTYASAAQDNPQGPSGGPFRVIRGGSWNDSARYARVASRRGWRPGFRFGFVGFRLARPAP